MSRTIAVFFLALTLIVAQGSMYGFTPVSAADERISDTSKITAESVPVTSVVLSKTKLSLTVEDTQRLTAAVMPRNATDKSVTWESTDPSVATVNSSGLISAKGEGKTTIIVKTNDGEKVDTCEVTVKAIHPTRVSLNKSSMILYQGGGMEKLIATVSPSNATDKSVTWESSDDDVAQVSSEGVITPVGLGTVTITVTTSNGKTDKCKVTVRASEGEVNRLRIEQVSETSAKISWSGTTGTVQVEIRKDSDHSTVATKSTSSRYVTFTGLELDVKYNLYLNGSYMDSFTLEDDAFYSVDVDELSDSSVRISWKGTTGQVKVEIRRESNGRVVDSERATSRSVKFTGLKPEVEYEVYINDRYADSFELEEDEVDDFDIEEVTDTTVEISWRGTSGTVRVELTEYRDKDEEIDSYRTDDREARFTGLDPNTRYSVYIDGDYAGSFRTKEAKAPDHVKVDTSALRQEINVSWSEKLGRVEVSLKRDGTVVAKGETTTDYIRFYRLTPNQSYDLYINEKFIQSIYLTFVDLENHWARIPIERLVRENIVNGFPDGTFRPSQSVTREEFIKMLVQAKGYNLVGTTTVFHDVGYNHWSRAYIETALENKILIASEIGSYFHPASPITREDMAVYLARAQELIPNASYLNFRDNNAIQPYKKGLIGAVVSAQIINGYPDGTFRPSRTLDRAEAAQVISRILK